MTRRSYMLMFLVAVLVTAFAAAAVMAQDGSPPSGDNSPEKAVTDTLDDKGNIITPDQRLAKIASEVEGGFGGYYLDETDPNHAYVYMKDTSKTRAANDAAESAPTGATVTRVTVVQGQYAFNDLLTWHDSLLNAMAGDEIDFSITSVDESQNRIVIGLPDLDHVHDVHELMVDLNIPEGAVIFEENEITPLAGRDSVQEEWRPVVGGIKFQIETWGQPCTIGFATERSSVKGLVVASHCTNSERNVGEEDDTDIHQPTDPIVGSKKVAEETIDPPLFLNPCVVYYECRWSDSAFAELESNKDIDRGKVARPTDVNQTDVSPAGSTYSITSDSGLFRRDSNIYIVGQNNGLQTARVTDTCVNSILKPRKGLQWGVMIRCVGKATPTNGSDGLANGDSGAPVFIVTSDNDVRLIGTAFAGDTSGNFVFSKLGMIYYELGSAARWDSCVSGC